MNPWDKTAHAKAEHLTGSATQQEHWLSRGTEEEGLETWLSGLSTCHTRP